MPFEKLRALQPDVTNFIDRCHERKRLVHSYIFEGDAPSVMKDAALYLSSKLLCEQQISPCGQCPTCEAIKSDNHLNVICVEKEKTVITKEQIIDLKKEFFYKSLIDKPRIYIITDADSLNTFASNALLKFLEEPFSNHYAILIVKNASRLLDTITSRSQLVRFKPVNKKVLCQELINKGINNDIAYILSNVSTSLKEAEELINDGTLVNIYEFIHKLMVNYNHGRDIYVEFFLKGQFIFDLDKKYQNIFLTILSQIISEKISFIKCRKAQYFKDIVTDANYSDVTVADLIKQIEKISEHQERLASFVNLELLYASLFLNL